MQENKLSEESVRKAMLSLEAKNAPPHSHGEKCYKLIRHIALAGEEIIFECKQSYLHSISPDMAIATTRRMIIVRPSFWGMYLGHDLVSPTEYSIIPYKHLISVMMSRGKMLSTIHMRIHGFTDATSSLSDEGEIYGIRTPQAVKLAKFLDEIIEYREEEEEYGMKYEHARHARSDAKDPRAISLEDAVSMVSSSKSKFAWIGVEPTEYVSAILGVGNESVVRITTAQITEGSKDQLSMLERCVFVSYGDETSLHLASFLKAKHGIDTYVLQGGIREVAHRYLAKRG